jgi:hypothetical protein
MILLPNLALKLICSTHSMVSGKISTENAAFTLTGVYSNLLTQKQMLEEFSVI